jgi:hypothetical protein
MPQHVHAQLQPLSLPHLGVRVVSVKLSVDEMKIGMRFRRDQSAILASTATFSHPLQSDDAHLVDAEFAFVGITAQKKPGQPPRHSLLANPLRTVE